MLNFVKDVFIPRLYCPYTITSQKVSDTGFGSILLMKTNGPAGRDLHLKVLHLPRGSPAEDVLLAQLKEEQMVHYSVYVFNSVKTE